MESTLKALADLLLEAVPTVVFFIFLAWYLKRFYFKPVAAILEERRQATEGVRELAQRASEAADQKRSEFDRALDLARADLQEEHDKLRLQWSNEQAAAIDQARVEADKQIQDAKHQIAGEVEHAQADLDAQVENLSQQIVNSLLERRAA